MLKKTVTYIIDILIVLVILAVGFYGYKIISNKVFNKNASTSQTVLVTVEFSKHDKDLLEKVQVGHTIMDSSKNEVIGTVKSVSEITDSVSWINDYENGKVVKASTPEYSLMTVVLECPAVITPTTIRVNNTDVRIGSNLGIRTHNYSISGTIMGLEIAE